MIIPAPLKTGWIVILNLIFQKNLMGCGYLGISNKFYGKREMFFIFSKYIIDKQDFVN